MTTKPSPIVAPFVATAPVIPGAPDPAVRLRRFLKRIAREYGVKVEWDKSSTTHKTESPKREATPR